MRKTELFLLIKNRNLSRQVHTRREHRFAVYTATAITALVSLALVVTLLGIGILYSRIARHLPSIEVLPVMLNAEDGELLQPSRLLDSTGQVILFTYQDAGIERRYLYIDPQKEDHISPQLVRTVTAALEPSFWESPGYDIRQWNAPQPCTIAENLVDELLLDGEPPSGSRNLRMRLLAAQVTAQYGRTRVLEWYLNSAWFGHYAYGAEAAAQLYLGKSAGKLTLAEAALLTPLLESPALNPLDAPDAAVKAQKEFLKIMLASGSINDQEYALAVAEKLPLRKSNSTPASSIAGFARQVERQLESTLGGRRVQRGGVDVITTLDLDLQQQFQCTAATQLVRVEYSNISGVAPSEINCDAALLLPTQSFSNPSMEGLAAGGLVMDPRSGNVLAYQAPITVSGESLNDSGYQPGSLLSPFAAVAAFARGYSPSSLLWDIPGSTTVNPQSGTDYHGAVNIRSAVANDYLNPIAALINNVGPANVWLTASAAGLSSLGDAANDASPLATDAETSLLDIGAAYSTLANSGVRSGVRDPLNSRISPNTILRAVTSSGRELINEAPAAENPILSQTLAYLVNHILSDESARWASLGYPNVLEIGSPVAAKTGSASGDHQVWTVGYTPLRLVLVWMGDGLEDGVPSTIDPRMAAGIWHALFRYATRDLQFTSWEAPAGITSMKVCSPSGMLPTADCPNIVPDVFLVGNEPTIPDTLYTRIKVNRETGLRATVFTPANMVEEKVFMEVPPEAREWALQAGLPLAPQGYDSIQQLHVDPDAAISDPAMFSSVSGIVKILGTAAGEKFASYTLQVGEGINPESWLQINENAARPVTGGVLAEWDTSGLNGLFALRLTVVDSENLVKTAVTQVTVDNTPPTAKITYPQSGQTVEPVRGGVTLTASAADLVSIGKVEWWVDGKLVSTQTAQPFVYQLLSRSGKHKALIKVWDLAGNSSQSAEVAFEIQP